MTVRLLSLLCICVMAIPASAQHRVRSGGGHDVHGNSRVIRQPHIDTHIRQPHIDTHSRVNRGHVIRRDHHGVVRSHRSHVVPNTIHGHATGQYYMQGGHYYYTPNVSHQHTVAKPAILQFGGFTQYADLSGRLETLVNEILLDLHYNYPHNPGFTETYREGYQLLSAAKFIHGAQHGNDREAMRSQLTGTDQQLHHIQNDVKGWTRIHHRQVGTLGIISKMELAEATLHHLMNDVGVSKTGQTPLPAVAPVAVPVPVAPAPTAP